MRSVVKLYQIFHPFLWSMLLAQANSLFYFHFSAQDTGSPSTHHRSHFFALNTDTGTDLALQRHALKAQTYTLMSAERRKKGTLLQIALFARFTLVNSVSVSRQTSKSKDRLFPYPPCSYSSLPGAYVVCIPRFSQCIPPSFKA